MKKGALEEQILRASKEIAVKFIEVGRLSPTGFAETFKTIYRSIDETVREPREHLQAENGPLPPSQSQD